MAISCEIIRSRRKTVSLQITPEGKLIVRCPSRMSRAEIDAFVQSKRRWIEARLAALPPKAAPFTPEQLEDLRRRAAEVIPERVSYHAARMGVSCGRVTIRAQRSRWGSCSGKGNLNFNCLLMEAPPEVLDYVVVHELCHRLEMNHSARFWALVERFLPDYRTHRDWLKKNGSSLIARLPPAAGNIEGK